MNNKIAVINPFGGSLGHSTLYATKICQSLAENGADVTLFTSSDYNPETVLEGQPLNFKISFTNVENTAKNKKDLKKISSILKYASKNIFETWKTLTFFYDQNYSDKFSVVHIIGGEAATSVIWGIFFLRDKKTKKFLTIHNSDYQYTLYKNQSKIKGVYKYLCSKLFSFYLLKSFDGIMVHGYQAKIDLEDQINNSKKSDKIFPISIGISKVDNILEHKKNDFITLLFFGVIRRDKGLDILLEALSRINSKKIKLKIVGNPSQIPYEEIMSMVSNTIVKDNIKCDLRYVEEDEIPVIFSECDYVVLPYNKTFKAQSVVLTLAAQYERPILCSNVGQNGYDVVKYRLGEVCESESVDALVDLIEKAIAGKINIPKANFTNYIHDNSWKMMGKKMMEMYNE